MNLLNIIIYETNKDFDPGYKNFNNIKKNIKKLIILLLLTLINPLENFYRWNYSMKKIAYTINNLWIIEFYIVLIN